MRNFSTRTYVLILIASVFGVLLAAFQAITLAWLSVFTDDGQRLESLEIKDLFL